MKRGFRFKVITAFLGGLVLLIALLVITSNILLRPLLVYDSKNTMQNYGEMIVDVYKSGSNTVSKLLDMLDSSNDIQTAVITNEFEVLLNSSFEIFPDSTRMSLIKKWLVLYDEGKDENGVFCREILDENDNLKRIVYIKNIGNDEYIVMSKVIKGIEQTVNISLMIISVIGVFIGIVAMILWYRLTKPFITQMEKMSRITKKMSQLNFDEKIDYHSSDEIGMLANSIDEMSDELKHSIDKLKKDLERRKGLIRDISHEIKTPVTTIRGYTENIQILLPDNKAVQRYCEIMVEECDVIDELVSEMLYMSKLENDGYSYEMVELDFEALKEKLLQRVRNEFLSERVSIEFEVTAVLANATLIERALFNYIANASKYRTPDTDIIVKGTVSESEYLFSVSNFGAEIEDSELEAIWDVFYKKDKSRTRSDNSHGIGLAIVKQIAVLHNGRVFVDSENGKTTFYIGIPIK